MIFTLFIVNSFVLTSPQEHNSDRTFPPSFQKWTYDGHSGPKYWGMLNPDWSLCNSGRFQSPIDVRPGSLLFDPTLRRMNVDFPKSISGTLINTGRDVTFALDPGVMNAVNLTDGPMTYHYRVAQIKLHFGRDDERGSEHTIDGTPFSAEVQLIAYNADIHSSLEEAVHAPYGIAILAVFVELAEPVNPALKILAGHAQNIRWKDQITRLENFSAQVLIPDTNYYLTYEGSLTQPGCHETVTWIIFNKAIHISKDLLRSFRLLQQGVQSKPLSRLETSRRPTMPLNNRVIRTNINYPSSGGLCNMARRTFYQINPSMRYPY